ncbi:MAG: hypothetical protein CVV11_03195 [Gammaproteobacteria bacterium HGW-Gammaproteobacteria-15]|nr:MAG: hypothetical protein CVV11_03195 [Gammaproteobacteria bacterium HGW-Gammaproteobacteria-15]
MNYFKGNMRLIIIVITALTLVACSSKPFISTAEHQDKLKQRCISALADELKQDKAANNRCDYDAMMSMYLAKRLYETGADSHYAQCKTLHAEKEQVDECFKATQVKYYDNWMTMPPMKLAK